jgi:hypothetical protein
VDREAGRYGPLTHGFLLAWRGGPPGEKRIAIGDPKITTLTPPAGEQNEGVRLQQSEGAPACRAFFTEIAGGFECALKIGEMSGVF